MANTKPKQTVPIVIVRNGKEQTLTAKLRRRPLDVIRPEDDDPLSMLMTLQQFDREKLGRTAEKEDEKKDEGEQDEEEKLPSRLSASTTPSSNRNSRA